MREFVRERKTIAQLRGMLLAGFAFRRHTASYIVVRLPAVLTACDLRGSVPSAIYYLEVGNRLLPTLRRLTQYEVLGIAILS